MRWGVWVGCVVLVGCFQPVTENIVGPEGGDVRFSGAALFIPPGALDSEVPFSATRVELPSDAPRALGPAFHFRPEYVKFKKPVELYVRIDSPSSTVDVLTASSAQGPWQRLPARVRNGFAQVDVTHFSVYYPTEPIPDAGAHDAGQEPHAGVLDAGIDAGAGTPDGGNTVDAGLSCVPACIDVGSACDRTLGRCVFGYQSLRIVEPIDESVVRRSDAGTVNLVVELTPIAGLEPVPPPQVRGVLNLASALTWLWLDPVADGGPYATSASVIDFSGARYEFQVALPFEAFPRADGGGYTYFREVVYFTIE
ncbi:MAG: hypothetical protein JNM17_22450 [Archangium sp.]|nr:hypothetical protein [Archangium sp.]